MNTEVTRNSLEKISADILLLFVFKQRKNIVPTAQFRKIDSLLDSKLSEIISLERFKGEKGEMVSYYTDEKVLTNKIVIVGLGEKSEISYAQLQEIAAGVAKKFKTKISSIALSLLDKSDSKLNSSDQAKAFSLGLLLGKYTFNQYQKSEKDAKELETLIISEKVLAVRKEIQSEVDFSLHEYQAVKLARDLVNEQSAVATPSFLANIAKDIARASTNITCAVYEEKDVEKMGMGAFLGVARGSDTPAKFIFLSYKPEKSRSKRKLALVGKGITFDSGGVSLKPDKYMTTMKCDMAGAAAVLGVFSVLELIKPNFEVMGLIASTPNLVSGSSYVPGDVLRAMNGKTIEVLNTDAEGRVTMADSISFAIKNGATEIIDLATLTGACMVALGMDYAGLFSNNENLTKSLLASAERTGEKLWEMPLPEDYKALNKSEVADIANIPSSPWGGAIAAGLFLQEFVAGKPWVHLDIAGPAFAEGEYSLGPKGGTGFGVQLLIDVLKNLK